ncbi:MAG TPA: gamma-glutamyl-gamma-aminobutyrate hydrolase family protein [Nocardioides sp.]|nr:gamma-glutamyl-gamma-aminobutyrate hydrolase family protein [Nocardioides sp.]
MSAVRRPVIGVAGHRQLVPRPFGELPVDGAAAAYPAAIAATGGRPVVVPSGVGTDLLDVLDAVVLTGGDDLGVDPHRDADEIALARAAIRAGVPVLGACRGLQVLTVALGGTLRGGLDHVHPATGHDVTTRPGSVVHRVLGARARTSALHRQAVADPGPHWVPTAWAEDGVVEAIEPADPAVRALGVQWHPELSWSDATHDRTGPAVFAWLAGVAGKGSTQKARRR